MDEVIQQSPIPQIPQAPIPNNSSFKNPTGSKIIPFIIVAIVLVGVGTYVLGTKKTQTVVQTAVIQPSPAPIDETANWKTYTNTKFGISIKYPADTRILETNHHTLPALNTDRDIVTVIQSTDLNYPRSYTGLNIYVNNDVISCSVLSSGKKITETKDINGVTFLVYGKNIPNDAMGGLRSSNDEYHIVHNNMCYSIASSVFWRDVSFDTTVKVPNSQELEEQQNWIQTQQLLNNQVFSTFKFTDQNQTVDPTANWKTYSENAYKFLVKYPDGWIVTPYDYKKYPVTAINQPQLLVTFQNKTVTGIESGAPGFIGISIIYIKPNVSFTNFLMQEKDTANVSTPKPLSISDEVVNVNSVQVHKVVYKYHESTFTQVNIPKEDGSVYMINSSVLNEDLLLQEEFLDQILSTFKFTN